jgi:hypothetical protein
MRRLKRPAAAVALLIGVTVTALGAQHVLREDDWPPEWYVDPAKDRAQYVAIRRRATAAPSTEFPPNAATIEYLRHLAVAAALDPGERIDDARVYPGAGYVLQLRGKFSTADISPPPGVRGLRLPEPFRSCLTYVLDTATITPTAASLGECEDFSFLGEGLELSLSD